jgi:uncharacterized membrane protein YgdD (TMEM256/DUF423 family)
MTANAVHRGLLLAAGICGFTGVLAGTFAAHALKARLSPEMLNTFEVGVRYHVAHALALLGLAIAAGAPPRSRTGFMLVIAGWIMVLGIVLFAGSLYALALSEEKRLGFITPFGGQCFLLGWLIVAIAALRAPKSSAPASMR